MAGYPVELNLIGKRALVVGLGSVGRRRVQGLVEAGATVLAIDPDPSPELRAELDERGVELRAVPYQADHLIGMGLVVAAATVEINQVVVQDARRQGIWVCSVSQPDEGDFTTPAVWREGRLWVAVSTSGASPAFAAALRDRAVEAIGPEAVELANILGELRPRVLASLNAHPHVRRELLADWAQPRWLDQLRRDGSEVVRHRLETQLQEVVGQLGIAAPQARFSEGASSTSSDSV